MTVRNPLKRSNKYRLLGLVGQGQFGQVFCAVHRKTGQLVALKNLDRARFPTHKFLRELRFLLSLQHPNIVNCQALEHTATGRYLVMDYCEAGTLRNLIDYETSLSLAQKIELVVNVLAGLEHAHERGIIHCDIKPENILLSVKPGGWIARISDFGIARVTQDDPLVADGNTGSPAYMAPERFYGQYSELSDLYAVGVLLYELLLGLRPFSGTPQELMSAHMNQHLVISEALPADLCQILQSALQKIPARRFRSATAMLAALRAVDVQQLVIPAPRRPEADLDQPGWVSRWALPPAPIAAPALHISTEPIVAIAVASDRPEPEEAVTAAPWLLAVTPAQLLGWAVPPEPTAMSPLPQMQFTMPRSHQIQAIVPDVTGCFVTTTQAISVLPWPPHPQLTVSAPQTPAAQMLLRLEPHSQTVVQPRGQWAACLHPQPGQPGSCLTLSRWRAQTETARWQVTTVKTVCALPMSEAHQPQQLIALDTRHLAVVVTVARPSGTRTQFDIYSRRGTYLGTQSIGLALTQFVPTRTPYQFLAREPDYPQAIVSLGLKPWRVQRYLLPVVPTCYTATAWGYALATATGEILLFNDWFELVGRLAGPPAPTAIAAYQNYGLLLGTATPPTLHTLDLRDGDIDLIF